MPHGIVIDDDQTIGYFTTLPETDNKVLIDFGSSKDRDRFVDMATEHGASLSFLLVPDGESM
jgi:hypothetical protein